jgi:hypothetical protein
MEDNVTEEIVRYDKTYTSLTEGRTKLLAKVQALDLTQPGVDGVIGLLTESADKALLLARDRAKREAAPYDKQLAEVKARWKPLIEGFDHIFRALKLKASEVITLQKRENEKKRAEAEAKLIEAKAAVKATASVAVQETNAVSRYDAIQTLKSVKAVLDELPPAGAPVGIKTESGTLFERETWGWEVENLQLVPDEYLQLMVDAEALDKAVASGVRTIAGILIKPTTGMVLRKGKR